MFEHRSQALLPRRQFYRRLAYATGIGVIMLAASLGVGMIGYHGLEGLPWIDAFLNAAMLLGGMGPVDTELRSVGGKLFAGVYSLYCGMAAILIASIMLSPVIHRFFHKLHIDIDQAADGA